MTDEQKKILMEGAGLSKEEVESECVAKAFDFFVLDNAKTLAIADKNLELFAENRKLWERNEALERGAEEARAIYEALTMQLVTEAGGSVTLAKTDVKALTKRCELRVEHNADGSMTLTVSEREANTGAVQFDEATDKVIDCEDYEGDDNGT